MLLFLTCLGIGFFEIVAQKFGRDFRSIYNVRWIWPFCFCFWSFFFTLWLGIEIKCPRNRPNTRKKWWGISSFLPACFFYFCQFILYFIHYILFLLVISTRVIIYSGLPKVAKKWTIKERDMNFPMFKVNFGSFIWISHFLQRMEN